MREFCPHPVYLEEAKNIAIVRRDQLGDLLLCQPMLRRLRQRAPQAKITLFGDKRQKVLLPYLPEIDQFIDVPIPHRQLREGYRFARGYRGQFDLALCARGLPNLWCNLFTHSLRAPQSVGHIDKDWHRHLIKQPLWGDPSYQSRTHHSLKAYHLIEPQASHVPSELYPSFTIAPAVKAQWVDWLTQQLDFGRPEDPILLLSVTNNRPHCILEMDRYAQAINRLAAQTPVRVVVSAMVGDGPAATALVQRLQPPAKAIPTESFDALLLLIQASRCLFIGEGGMVHLAAALNKPQMIVIAQSSPIEWGPLSLKARWLSHALHVNALPQQAIERELQIAWGLA
jgi:ADP-heptose:LPS heptosyltransferase